MIEEPRVRCPHCGETITIVVDTTAGDQQYVEDCFVCCAPIVFTIAVDADGHITALEAAPEND